MQLFIISPLVLIPASAYLKKNEFMKTMLGLLALNVFFTFLPMAIKLLVTDYTK